MIEVKGAYQSLIVTLSQVTEHAQLGSLRQYIRDATGDDLVRAGWHHVDFNKLVADRNAAEKELERYKSIVRLLNPKLHELIESAGKIE